MFGQAKTPTYYKWLNIDGDGPVSRWSWPLPVGDQPGDWTPLITDQLVVRERGYHVITANGLLYWLSARLFTCEGRGKPQKGFRSKYVFPQARLLQEYVLLPSAINSFVATLLEWAITNPIHRRVRLHPALNQSWFVQPLQEYISALRAGATWDVRADQFDHIFRNWEYGYFVDKGPDGIPPMAIFQRASHLRMLLAYLDRDLSKEPERSLLPYRAKDIVNALLDCLQSRSFFERMMGGTRWRDVAVAQISNIYLQYVCPVIREAPE